MAINRIVTQGVGYLLLAGVIYAYTQSISYFDKHPVAIKDDTLRVVLPENVQVATSFGDRHLAANIGMFRAITLEADHVDDETAHVLGEIQRTASDLNTLHEDNYYTAQAILPWTGEPTAIDATVYIESEANRARFWDVLPTFFYGFDQYYFLHDPKAASHTLLTDGVARSEGGNKEALKAIAAKWYEHMDDPHQGKAFLLSLRQGTRDPQMLRLLDARLGRLDGLIALNDAADRFEKANGHRPAKLQDLVTSHMITALPVDPLGTGYRLNSHGIPEVAR